MKNKVLSKYEKYLTGYLVLLFLMSVSFLHLKHETGNDSTISEWLINYTGGFTKRGIIGQISIIFSRFFETELRDTIFYFQTVMMGSYFVLIYIFLRNFLIERVYLLAIFSPIFLLYPVYEVEVLARKEVFVFIFFLLHLFILINKIQYSKFSKLITFTVSVLIWEPIIFFLPMWIFIDIITNKKKQDLKFIFKELVYYLPALMICTIYIFDPLTKAEHSKMASILKEEFGEICYMSCSLLISKSTLIQQFTGNFHAYSFENIFRYIIIVIIGFAPLFILLNFSKIKNNKNIILKYTNLSLSNIFLMLLSPVIILFLMGYDWGRWVNISYVMTLLTFLYLYKNKLIVINMIRLKKHKINSLSLKSYSILFFIYCFTWSQKTVITGDIGSFPLYRALYKLYKISFVY